MAGELRRAAAVAGVATVGILALAPGVAMGAADQPNWKYFKNVPFLDGRDDDRRVIGCVPLSPSGGTAPPCEVNERTTAAAATTPWDTLAGLTTFTTNGDYADSGLSGLSPIAPGPDRSSRPTSATRDYFYPFTDQWRNSKCNPENFAGGPSPSVGTDANDINAAIVNVFVAHNHMHDWSYGLGFTPTTFNMEGTDPIFGNVQAGAKSGPPTFSGRDAANHTTPADGTSPSQTSYLWQPIAGAYYPTCVDGSFDMSVIAHEYAHAVANRMVGGPTEGLTSSADGQALAIGEGFADSAAVAYLHEHGYAPADDEDPFTVGAYVTGNRSRGVRNYSMAHSPLNYSNVQGWDGSGGANPSDDGEIWAAVNHDIRQALVAAHADGDRRWMQIAFQALLTMPANATMVQARDAYIAAPAAAGDGDLLWTAFARRGLGAGASSSGTDDPNPEPSFESPLRTDETTLTFAPSANAELFVGDHEAGVTPVADTNPATALDDTVAMVPGTYSFVARGAGLGTQKFQRTIPASSSVALDVVMPPNRASAANGATASGDGARHEQLIDDTEATNWEVVDRAPDVRGAQVTVKLAGGLQRVESVNVSALLRGTDDGDEREDGDNQNRFTALRQFELHTCQTACDEGGAFTNVYTSPADAFPGVAPRPVTPDLNLRSFDVPDTAATHVRLVVGSNQCTGLPLFHDNDLDTDLSSNSDCTLGNAGGVGAMDRTVRAAELQVFSTLAEVATPPVDPAPALTAVSMRPKRFRLGRKLPRDAAVKTGTTIRFNVSEAAAVTYGFRRARPGRRVGRRCLAPTRARKGRRRCTRYVRSGSLKRAAGAGPNRLRFHGRLTRRRALRPGTYRLTLVATDAAGQRSAPRTMKFRLLARRR